MKVYGPYKRKDGRSIVILRENNKQITVSYPKYLMEKHLGRKLVNNETVDHINGDATNNDLSNLRVLSRSENARIAVTPAPLVVLTCKYCGKVFTRQASKERHNRIAQGKDGLFCSKHCAGKVHH